MVNAKFMKAASADGGVVAPEMDSLLEQAIDGVEDQMEQIEKVMRPLTTVHPAAIIAGTIVAGKQKQISELCGKSNCDPIYRASSIWNK